MKKSLKEAWKEAENQLSEQEPVEITAQQMASLYGGNKNSAGIICSVSAECRASGKACKAGQVAQFIFDALTYSDPYFDYLNK